MANEPTFNLLTLFVTVTAPLSQTVQVSEHMAPRVRALLEHKLAEFARLLPVGVQTLAPDGRCVSSINVGQVRYWCEAGPEGHDGLCRGSDQWGGRAEWRWSSVAPQRPTE